ncbi:hypothetical protein PRCB_24520 [Pantoea rodasii]|uniref:Uncharacterized protein n=1 Tax=Pantoea rodasii TaxID=1076549 RepID=A0A2M9W5S6_9GAMM|nr:hypothetical protein PRCB_24520 [Pantoea rodasii]
MTETDRFRTPILNTVRKSVNSLSYIRYNSYILFVHKISLCHVFLLTVVSRPWSRQPKISEEKLRRPVSRLNLSD